MWTALSDILPYTIGLIVSPLPVVAVIVLMVSQGGSRKATIFEIAWLVVSFVFLVALVALFSSFTPSTQVGTPTWKAVVVLCIGALLLIVGLFALLVMARKRRILAKRAPKWLAAMDTMKGRGVAGLAALLVVANPVNASMILAAAASLNGHHLPFVQTLLPALIFVLVGSIAVVTPYVIALVEGERAQPILHRVRLWMVRYNNVMTVVVCAAFGAYFLTKGIRELS